MTAALRGQCKYQGPSKYIDDANKEFMDGLSAVARRKALKVLYEKNRPKRTRAKNTKKKDGNKVKAEKKHGSETKDEKKKSKSTVGDFVKTFNEVHRGHQTIQALEDELALEQQKSKELEEKLEELSKQKSRELEEKLEELSKQKSKELEERLKELSKKSEQMAQELENEKRERAKFERKSSWYEDLRDWVTSAGAKTALQLARQGFVPAYLKWEGVPLEQWQ